jgi:short-subunit dehydrogenase
MSSQESKGIAVITGASSGIGAIYADRLAKRGFDLLLVARDQTRLDRVAQAIHQSTGRNVEVLVADLTLKNDLKKVEERLQVDSKITALVNNAGFGGAAGLLGSDIDELENMIALNVTALTRLTAAVLPGLVTRASGTVINIASVVALNPEVLNGTYSGTKSYVLNFTQALFKELKGKGIQVQAVLPGATRTEFWGHFGVPHSNIEAILMSSEDCVDAALAGLDQGELITIPALEDVQYQTRFEEARLALYPFLSNKKSADRYHTMS